MVKYCDLKSIILLSISSNVEIAFLDQTLSEVLFIPGNSFVSSFFLGKC